jgi:hypothetical protein
MTDDTYNGHPNRETYMFHLHVANDEYLQNLAHRTTRAVLANSSGVAPFPFYVGEIVIAAIRDAIDDNAACDYPSAREFALGAMRDIGSFWRIDESHVGAAMLRDVAEIDA